PIGFVSSSTANTLQHRPQGPQAFARTWGRFGMSRSLQARYRHRDAPERANWEHAAMTHDWPAIVADLEQLLKLRSIPFGMKLYADRAEMEAIPRIRRPQHVHTLDQLVGQASRLGWTVGVTSEDLVGAQCRAVVGLGSAKTDEWKSGRHMTGVWFETVEDASAHQAAMHCVPDGQFEALAIGPLASGKLGDPDIALFYATPGAM